MTQPSPTSKTLPIDRIMAQLYTIDYFYSKKNFDIFTKTKILKSILALTKSNIGKKVNPLDLSPLDCPLECMLKNNRC